MTYRVETSLSLDARNPFRRIISKYILAIWYNIAIIETR